MNPTTMPANVAHTKLPAACHSENEPASAAKAVRRVTSAEASLKRLSPSSTAMRRGGSPSRLPILVAATASMGATTAPRAMARAIEISGNTRWMTAPIMIAGRTTIAMDSQMIIPAFLRRSTTGIFEAVENSNGGRNPARTSSGSSSTSGMNDGKLAAMPRQSSSSGAAMPVRAEDLAAKITAMSPAARNTKICTTHIFAPDTRSRGML